VWCRRFIVFMILETEGALRFSKDASTPKAQQIWRPII
jgi:hypothetical protein